ncbi:MAG TPA: aminotransferase class V-fold PLP-dependent enzyme [Isosphaeraceae bacterium]|nr:aminotransferase class V-fold PLP-dependent enzyme [Isosphaeraceae bacterium]
MRPNPVYLDNHATTRTDPRVVEAMIPYFTELYGNSASTSHRFGSQAAEAVERARAQVARALGAEPREIVFTSGATESNNLAIKGVARAATRRGNHLVTAASEHRAVLDPFKRLARQGWEITVVPCDENGRVSAAAVAVALTERTVLVSIMAANNEVGAINPIAEIGRLCHDHGVVFHTDAAQAVGKIPLDVQADSVDLLSLSAHKIYGPKGIGALYVRRRDPQVRLEPLVDGGGHERGLRSGTLPVPLVVGLGLAAEIAMRERDDEARRLLELRERLHQGIAGRVPGIRLNGPPADRLPGNLNLSFGDVDGEALMMAMRDIAVSSGSACSSAEPEPSHVLLAIGLDEDMARASLRFGLGRFTTTDEIDFAIDTVAAAVERLRTQTVAWSVRDGA